MTIRPEKTTSSSRYTTTVLSESKKESTRIGIKQASWASAIPVKESSVSIEYLILVFSPHVFDKDNAFRALVIPLSKASLPLYKYGTLFDERDFDAMHFFFPSIQVPNIGLNESQAGKV